MTMKEKLPNIFNYNNFCTYLADYQTVRQKYEKKFNTSNISKLIELPNTRSYFSDVLIRRDYYTL